ncbi:hypothetical protein BDZ89DRAFT_580506 [Hymenopellis radicata]|nr:hypothetical protein BDZ89DRAFT_580506 [Hymenopellis radicata]
MRTTTSCRVSPLQQAALFFHYSQKTTRGSIPKPAARPQHSSSASQTVTAPPPLSGRTPRLATRARRTRKCSKMGPHIH